MIWTSEKPTVPGWYWHRWSDGLGETIVRAFKDTLTQQWMTQHIGSTLTYTIPRDDDRGDHGEWAGPLEPPEGRNT